MTDNFLIGIRFNSQDKHIKKSYCNFKKFEKKQLSFLPVNNFIPSIIYAIYTLNLHNNQFE